MDIINYTTTKEKNKHLCYSDYRFIESEYNHYISSKVKSSSKTVFMRSLASKVNTCLSNLYKIIKDGMVELRNSDLTLRKEFSADLAYRNRQNEIPNNLRIMKAKEYLELIENQYFKKKKFWSLETIVNDFKLNHSDLIKNMNTICLKTIYNYIHKGLLTIKPIDLPIATKRKIKPEKKEYKKTKGTSIEERPSYINDRTEFGHWEGDTVIGKKSKDDSSIITLVERKTRFQIAIKIKHHTATSVYREINKLEKKYGDRFKNIFKSITFDNGAEFSRYKDIEIKKGSKVKRTTVYFAHPYSSWERGSNERHNKFLRFFIKKGAAINDYSKEFVNKACELVNKLPKKVLGYKTSLDLFNLELSKLI